MKLGTEGKHLKVGLDWIFVTVLSEPKVVLSYRGFCPVVDVVVGDLAGPGANDPKLLFIGSKSLSFAIKDRLTGPNHDEFRGLTFWIRRRGASYMHPFEVSFEEPKADQVPVDA